jgi:hypothetical protein
MFAPLNQLIDMLAGLPADELQRYDPPPTPVPPQPLLKEFCAIFLLLKYEPGLKI